MMEFEVESIKGFFSVDANALKARMLQFAKMDTDKSGRVSEEQFVQAFP